MEQTISSDLIRGHIDTIILHTLLDGDKYAQQINDTIEEKSEKKYSIIQATLYSSLKRLENLSFVKSYWFDAEDGRRKYFKITEKGIEEVDKNLSSWAFSRLIIDKLMDYQAEENVVNSNQSPVFNDNSKNIRQEFTVVGEKNENISEQKIVKQTQETSVNAENNDKKEVSATQEEKEINFRTILYGLIKTTTISKNANDGEKMSIEPINVNSNEKPKFNETITEYDYNSQKNNNNGKIDFGDLTLAAAKDGYKIRISSKDSAKPFGNLYSNKLKFAAATSVLFLVLLEIILFSLTAYKNDFRFINAFLPFIAAMAITAVFAVIYFKNPLKTTSKQLNGDKILTASIIVFNFMLITFALNFLFGTDFEIKLNVISFIVVPIVVFVDFILYFVAEYALSKLKIFHVKRR